MIALASPSVTGDDDGLAALARFARQAAGADQIIAFEAGADGIAVPLAAEPGPLPRPFAIGGLKLTERDWSAGPVPARTLRLPSSLLAALGRPAQQVLYLPAPVPEAVSSGVLLLFASNAAWQCDCPFRTGVGQGVPFLGPVFGQMIAARRAMIQRRQLGERFHDLFESVSSGIVILEGDGSTGLVNQTAASLLSIPAGEVPADRLASAMRTLREGAANAAKLADTYAPLQGDLNYALIAHWRLGERQYAVDTHPILGDGNNGRIWLFDDVTDQRRAHEELQRQAGTDPLTSLPNRRHFTAVAQGLLERMRREERPVSLLMLDIDHFKSINDRFGHAVGDKVLRAVAQRCRDVLRERDVIARLGGEEFAAILPNAGPDEGAMVAERIRAAVAATPVDTVEVRISIGGTTASGGADVPLDVMLERADQALYAAKRGGRNRVVVNSSS